MKQKLNHPLVTFLMIGSLAYCLAGGRTAETVSASLTPIGGMTTPRAAHTATLLRDGRVLLAGGFERERVFFASAEFYNPATGMFTRAANMNAARVGHTATRLPNGKVLVAGGIGNGYLASAEIYDPETGAWSLTGSMAAARDGFTATLLYNGKALIAGGYNGSWHAEAEIYDPATGRFTPTGRMTIGRFTHTATLLPNGKVLITGGNSARNNVLASAELYDPATGVFTPTGGMTRARYKHAAVLLPGGDVLIAGGSDNRDWDGRYSAVEVYRASDGVFASLGSMSTARFKFPDAIVRLPGGKALMAGAGEQVETYDAGANSFATADGRMDAARYYMTATLLSDGRVLIAGGYNRGIVASGRAWIYDDPNARISTSVVSAASYDRVSVAPEAISAAFGTGLATGAAAATSLPLPTELANTTVRVNGVLAGLFFVSAGQVNFLIPAETKSGPATVEISAAGGAISRGSVDITATAPGLFTSNLLGAGAPAALATADGVNFKLVGNPDGTPNPLDPGDYLILFGTGLRRALPGEVTITIGGVDAPTLYAGAQPDYAGLDQVNTRIPAGVSGVVELTLTVNGRAANPVKVKIN